MNKRIKTEVSCSPPPRPAPAPQPSNQTSVICLGDRSADRRINAAGGGAGGQTWPTQGEEGADAPQNQFQQSLQYWNSMTKSSSEEQFHSANVWKLDDAPFSDPNNIFPETLFLEQLAAIDERV